MRFTIFLVKESRAGETRVALTPTHVKELVAQGHTVFVEQNAGALASISDNDYIEAGATIRTLESETSEGFAELFFGVTHIVRVKRPARERETLENKSLPKGTVMIGALDPLEHHSPHLEEYKRAGIEIHSIDQLALPSDHPMNILAAMSKIAGRLALVDAISKFKKPIEKVVIIGFGAAGESAFNEAIKQQLNVTVMLRDVKKADVVMKSGGKVVLFDKDASLSELQGKIKDEIINASIVITSIRSNNAVAPLLIPTETLEKMPPGTVIVDLALSEGGNVEGSKHDATLLLGNQIIVTNVSGYPKAEPKTASMLWSQASLLYLQQLK